MGTVQEWLEGVAKTNKSSEDDSRKMQSLLHKVGFGKAVVVYGIVYPEGRGRPVSIHAMAKEILSTIPAKKKGEWAKRTKRVVFPAGRSSKAKHKSKRTTSKASRVK